MPPDEYIRTLERKNEELTAEIPHPAMAPLHLRFLLRPRAAASFDLVLQNRLFTNARTQTTVKLSSRVPSLTSSLHSFLVVRQYIQGTSQLCFLKT